MRTRNIPRPILLTTKPTWKQSFQQERFFRETMEKEHDLVIQKHGQLLQAQKEKYIVTFAHDIARKARTQAQAEGTNIQAVIRRALYEYLEKNQR